MKKKIFHLCVDKLQSVSKSFSKYHIDKTAKNSWLVKDKTEKLRETEGNLFCISQIFIPSRSWVSNWSTQLQRGA